AAVCKGPRGVRGRQEVIQQILQRLRRRSGSKGHPGLLERRVRLQAAGPGAGPHLE
ncbi:unnamed protein product, partial [Prorocentrum cordatum]